MLSEFSEGYDLGALVAFVGMALIWWLSRIKVKR
jgi:hypothetical protein